MPLLDFARHQIFRLMRTAFRLAPMPTATRDRWRQRFLDRYSGMVPAGPRGQAPTAGMQRALVRAVEHAIGYRPHRSGTLPSPMPATLVAFYLPQFHPIPENDAWWGVGFTEWRNVTRALPQFEGHRQPRLPADLGFYDLRSPDVIQEQMRLARDYGVGAFCTYFYWFAGKTLLEAPLRQWLTRPELDLPICLCWANENWSRRWDGRADAVLVGQRHSADDDLAFIAHVAEYLKDPRYLRVGGKPMLLVYRPGLLPSPRETAERWRSWCRRHGVGEIHLAYVQSFDRVTPDSIGFDAAIEFPPNNTSLAPITNQLRLINPDFAGDVLDWRELAHKAMGATSPEYLLYPGVNPGWDNEPRRSGRGRVLAHASPRGYRDWLRHAISVARARAPDAPMVFINAWNEWAEGAVLEPDARLGHAWLDATRAALLPSRESTDRRPCVVGHVRNVKVLDGIVSAMRDTRMNCRLVLTASSDCESDVRRRLSSLNIDAEVQLFEDRGSDLLPFLHVADRLLDEGVDLVLRLPTVPPEHRKSSSQAQEHAVQNLASTGRASAIAKAFAAHPRLGLVLPDAEVRSALSLPKADGAAVHSLCSRLGLPQANADGRMPGNMFWVRLAALRPVLDAHLEPWEFGENGGGGDLSANAFELVFELAAAAAGFEVRDAGDVCRS